MDVTKAKLMTATAGGFFASWLGTVWPLFFFAFAAILLDYATGLLAGRANEGLNSGKATKGLYKKVGLLTLLCLGFLLDAALNHYIAQGLSFDMPFDLPLGLVVSVWIVITEAISICENLGRLGVPIPPWLSKVIHGAHGKINGKGEDDK